MGAWAGLINKVHLLHETILSRLGEVALLPNAQKQHRESRKMKKHKKIFEIKQQNKQPETDLIKMKISDFPERVFKIMVIKMLIKDKREM